MYIIENSDCLEGLRKLTTSIDLTVTSPPYFNVKEYVSYESYELYLETLKEVFSLILEKTNDGRMCCVNISNIIIARKSRSHESTRIPLAFHFVSLMERIGWKFMEDIIWVKPEGSSKNRNGGFFQHRQPVAYKPNVVNEYILVFQKPSTKLIDSIVRKYDVGIAEASMVSDGYERTNVWHMNPETSIKHPAPYPQGTTAVVAKKLNRNCIGFEIHKEYVDLANSRLNSVEVEERNTQIKVPSLQGESLREWLTKKSKRFLLGLYPQPSLKKIQLVSAIYEKFSSQN